MTTSRWHAEFVSCHVTARQHNAIDIASKFMDWTIKVTQLLSWKQTDGPVQHATNPSVAIGPKTIITALLVWH